MSTKIKKFVIHYDHPQDHVRITHDMDAVVDFPYVAGEMQSLIPETGRRKLQGDKVPQPLFNRAGLTRIVVDVGQYGVYYLQVRSGYKLENIHVEPDDVVVDIYYTDRQESLIYGFYNPTRRQDIVVTAALVEDLDGVYQKLSADPADLNWRQYFVRRAIVKPGSSAMGTPPATFPPIMTAKQIANYLQMEEKTIRNWTSDGKIPSLKVGGASRYRKQEIDDWLAGGKSRVRKSKKRESRG